MAWKPDYTDLDTLKAVVNATTTGDDALLTIAITSASRSIDDFCGRQFGKLDTPAARYYESYWDARAGRYIVPINDVQTTTALVVKTNDYDTDLSFGNTLVLNTDYRLAPYNAAADAFPWTMLVGAPLIGLTHVGGPILPLRQRSIEVTATWGWTAIPSAIVQATLLQASRLFVRKDAPFGIAGSPSVGSEMRLMSRLDPDVEMLVRPYRRMWGVV